ncbi:MAG: P1 family peptidase [Anaerolineae bacterium]|nr:P1 family peptidase [Anaerolineae bacterium]
MPEKRPSPREAGLRLGTLPTGPGNAITDVAGVRVGHASVIEGQDVRTGVTVVLPHGGNLFREKVVAAAHTINGFGKPCGLEQIRELGTLESPIALTSTLNVPRVADGLLTWMLAQDEGIARQTSTVNVVVGECNDAYLNDARGRHVREEHVLAALNGASAGPVAQGAVGAGVGMVAFGYKGGVGTASRQVPGEMGGWTVGALVVSNMGRRRQLTIDGVPVGRLLAEEEGERPESGSIMVVLASDAPLTARQLGRLCRRVSHGLARTGSISGSGSGDFAIAFSTAQRIPHASAAGELQLRSLPDESPAFDLTLQAVVEAVEEAVIASLFRAETVTGYAGRTVPALPLPPVLALLQRYGRLREVPPEL